MHWGKRERTETFHRRVGKPHRKYSIPGGRSTARRFFRRQYEHGREERPSVLGAGGEWNEVVPRKFAMSAAIQRLGRRPGNLMRHKAVGDGRPE